MTWSMPIDPLNNIYLSAALAAVPILFLFWALAVKKLKGHWTSVGAMSISILIAIIAYGMPIKLAGLAALNGMLFGLWPVIWIVLTAVFLYNLSVEMGQFEVIKNSLASITDDRRLQTLLIAFSFGAFLEGAAGFGTPVAIAGAMLLGLGFNPLWAAGLCLIANTAPVAFGAIGIPIVVAGQVSGLDTQAISQMVGRTLPVVALIIPMYLVMLMAGIRKGLQVWPAVLVSGGTFALGQWASAEYLGPMLPDIVASISSIVALTVFLRFWHPKESWRFADEAKSTGKEKLKFTLGQVFRAWAPFIILSVLVGAWGIKPVKAALDQASLFKLPMAGLDQMVIRDGKPMAAVFSFNTLSAAGTAILISVLLSMPVMGAKPAVALRVFVKTLKTLKFSILSVSCILGFAYVMNFSGMAITLGNAFVATGGAFLFFSPFLGWLGVFMTGSDTSANALFGKLQEVTASKIGVDPVIAVAANTSGGGCGKMISPQSLSVATAATNQVGKEADIFRFTFKHSLVLTTVVACVVFLQASLLSWMVPQYVRSVGPATQSTQVAPPSSTEGVIYLLGTFILVGLVILISRAVGQPKAPTRSEGSDNAAA